MKIRKLRRPSTRSAGHDEIVCTTARTMKPSAIRLTAVIARRAFPLDAIHRQLTKLKAATASQISPCHQRKTKASSNSARQNSQNTTTLPVESAISGACQAAIADVTLNADVAAWAAEPMAKATASLPATELR